MLDFFKTSERAVKEHNKTHGTENCSVPRVNDQSYAVSLCSDTLRI